MKQFQETVKNRQKLVQAMPEIMGNNKKSTDYSHSEGHLDQKTKELISLAMSIIILCDECILHHTINLVKLKCTREEFIECLELSITLQSCPGIKYSQLALDYYDQLVEELASGD